MPLLDNDTSPAHENVPLASIYLRYALSRSPENRFWTTALVAGADRLDDNHLSERIVKARPSVLACTLYLWNVERTLHLLGRIRPLIPDLRVIVGGPEVARDHPFLFRSPDIDVAVTGEGEPVFPSILTAIRKKGRTNFKAVAWKIRKSWAWGTRDPTQPPLLDVLPPPGWKDYRPDGTGMAYLETTRGCPMDCTYCCYNQRRRGVSFLNADEVLRRIAAFRKQGVREIRIIDPTFNANPHFEEIISRLAAARGRRLKFFAELRPDRISKTTAQKLARAGFAEIEVGVQCRNPTVLRAIKRPLDLRAVDQGIRHLSSAGIRVTLDLMYGLPGQTLKDVRRDIRWAAGRRNVRVQCLQTLVLPGTEIRTDAKQYRMQFSNVPPYPVTATSTMSEVEIRRSEAFIEHKLGYAYDCPTEKFVGHSLPDLFAEKVVVDLDRPKTSRAKFGRENCQSVFFRSRDLCAHRKLIRQWIRQAIAAEPYALWQFILEVDQEEPLDLLDILIEEIMRGPALVLDRFIGNRFSRRRASRRLYIQWKPGRRFDRAWIQAAEDLLRKNFF